MKTIMWDPLVLKPLLGLKGGPKDEEFRNLRNYMEQKKLPKNAVIREAGVVESNSHVLLEGLIGMYFNRKLVRLFFPGDMFLDFESYSQQIPSRFQIKVLFDACFTSLSFENEMRVLNEITDFREVSDHLKARVRHSNEEWIAFTQLHYMDRLRELVNKFPKLILVLSVNDLCGLLGIGKSTAIKLRKVDYLAHQKAKSDEELVKQIKYPFEALKHPQSVELEDLAHSWAYNFHSFFTDLEEFKSFKNKKHALLSSYLYPEIDFFKGLWINKLFVWLFYLDDKTDLISPGAKEEFWTKLELWILGFLGEKNANLPFLPQRLTALANAFQDLWNELHKLDNVTQTQIDLIQSELLDHIKFSRIEAGFKDKGTLPSISEYLEIKPYISAAKLAVSLSCLEFEDEETIIAPFWQKTEELRSLGASLIYFDNDLFSYKKEQAANDQMNYIALLIKQEGLSLVQAKKKVLEDQMVHFKAFMELNKKWMNDFNPDNHLILQKLKFIKYKISGARLWSTEISKRYEI